MKLPTPKTTTTALLSCSQPSKRRRLTRCLRTRWHPFFQQQHRMGISGTTPTPDRHPAELGRSPAWPIEGTGWQTGTAKLFTSTQRVLCRRPASLIVTEAKSENLEARQTIPQLVQDASADLSLPAAPTCARGTNRHTLFHVFVAFLGGALGTECHVGIVH